MLVNRKHIVGIISVMIAAVVTVGILAWVSLKPVNRKNGFSRNFLAAKPVLLAVAEKDPAIQGICGSTRNTIYFKTFNPSKIWATDTDLQNKKLISLNVPSGKRVSSGFYTEIDSPFVNIMAGNVPAVIATNLTGKAVDIRKFPANLYTRATLIGKDSYIFRGFDTSQKKTSQIFMKGNAKSKEITARSTLASNNDDGGITTDGSLSYDKLTHKLIYVSFYQNTFYCIDTNLKLIYTAHTIDTTKNIQFEAKKSGDQLTNTTPARIINGKSRLSEGSLYVFSRLQSDNESSSDFRSNAAIDIYDIASGKYKGSLYIPLYERQKIMDFRIIGKDLYVVYQKHIAKFSFP